MKKGRTADAEVGRRLAKGLEHHRRGELAEAGRLYEAILAARPDHAMALNLAGVLAYQRGDLGLGVERLVRAVAIEPENTAFHNNLGEVYGAAGELDKALAHFAVCLRANPDDAAAHNNIGRVHVKKGDRERALACFSKCLAVRPDHREALYNTAVTLIELDRLDEALAPLRRAVAADATFADGYALLGDVLYRLGRHAEAVGEFRRALALEGRLKAVAPTALFNNLGGALKQLHRIDEAEGCFRAAVERSPESASLLGNLANFLEQVHRVDEAGEVAARALAGDPGNLRATLVMARIELRAGELEAARRRLEGLAERASQDALLPSAFMDLGRLYDRLGMPDRAFAAWERGNRLLAASPKWQRVDKEALFRDNARLKTWLAAGGAAALPRAFPDDSLADPVFLVGFPRSGTTLLEQIVAAGGFAITGEQGFVPALKDGLPRVVGPSLRYPDDLGRVPPAAVGELRAAYWRMVGEALGPAAARGPLLDKLPLNLCSLGLIQLVFPGARVLVALRDPRDVCLSNFMQNYEPNEAMAPFLGLESAARAYASVMELWLAYRAQLALSWREVRYEDLVDDFEGTARPIIEFIGATWSERVREFHRSAATKYVSTPSFRDVASPIYGRAVGRWTHYRRHLEPILPVLEPYVAAFGYDASASSKARGDGGGA